MFFVNLKLNKSAATSIVRIKRRVNGIDFSQQLPDIYFGRYMVQTLSSRRLGQLGAAWFNKVHIKYIGICGA